MTAHIAAEKGDFAKAVLMPGDPLRAKYIAEKFLDGAKLVNNVRGICGYTGSYKGTPVSVMGSGMGMPSMSIYATELFRFFGVETIIRTGSAGALTDKLALREVVIAGEAVTDSNIVSRLGGKPGFPVPADGVLVALAAEIAEDSGVKATKGTIYSSDVFYAPEGHNAEWSDVALAVEMEAAALYAIARNENKRALAICTISDNAITGNGLPAEEREQSFNEMINLALEVAIYEK